jgi:hypothetical protein
MNNAQNWTPMVNRVFDQDGKLVSEKIKHTPDGEWEDLGKPIAWLYPEGLEALRAGKCWTAYGTKQDDQCNIALFVR